MLGGKEGRILTDQKGFMVWLEIIGECSGVYQDDPGKYISDNTNTGLVSDRYRYLHDVFIKTP